MKKILIFIFNNEQIHEADAKDLDTDTIGKYKCALAASRGINSDLIEVIEQDEEVQELSSLMVRADKALMYYTKGSCNPRFVERPTAALDINHPELEEEFLSLIFKGDIDNAITFM